jgi:hypothetical protein
MLKTKIKTHRIGQRYQQPHFFILNKGNNAGKPLPEYCANCFVFLADDEEERDFYFFIFMGLWELKYFRPHLIGFVVEYIRIGDLTDLVEETVNAVNTGERKFADVQDTLFQIEFAKSNLQHQVKTLMELRHAIFYRYLKR